ncbi:unnamed protein product [Eruca vesicaria subsp. sativa]|uniref:Uncharacterized protein n=1 Tax=Eruca vesicaria subsp. sativa TaxID=29727 RepID=A0ABC8LWJ6_ERUVS|nr:unnamed protein product [Eruca vesicaria subsp. sativa]
MRTLTGVSLPFEFVPLSVVSFGSTVIAESCDAATSVSWIHAWTVSHGIITQVREYSNTSLTMLQREERCGQEKCCGHEKRKEVWIKVWT